MPVYRALKALSKGHEEIIPAGSVININWLNRAQLEKLESVGAISQLVAPPLHKLPGWRLRAEKLGGAGVNSVTAFLESDDTVLAERLDMKPDLIAKWKQELVQKWLTVAREGKG